jgi:hypothetical protein
MGLLVPADRLGLREPGLQQADAAFDHFFDPARRRSARMQ